ncbi:hypothetical protein HXX76_003920 [Chlamydomonas incerta]|uniref:SET domain-containing protein n=1 Tax=Chlamydomonas incerta TaxID=51695 RepID=A0A835T8X6_CHLIN|nr:hypothetical protein HXX76_003920 [Chlamydomonas incerta]|eukprot:KAG2441067.1 hypothetical protein HXX76_003920 [Chlamydomonas incerta]
MSAKLHDLSVHAHGTSFGSPERVRSVTRAVAAGCTATSGAGGAGGDGSSSSSVHQYGTSTGRDTSGAAQWQSQGNALFGSGHFVDALHAYQQGLAALQADQAQQQEQPERQHAALAEQNVTLLNNSAAACLGFGAHESAGAYASLALRRVPGDAGALLHLARALEGLGRYSEAADACAAHLNALSGQARSSSSSLAYSAATTTDFAAGQRFLQSLRRRAAEAERGEYDEAGMAREAAASAAPRLEAHADFIGPVAVADAGEGRGRIMVTSAPVRAGQLLLAMRADALCYDCEVPASFQPPLGQRSRAHLQLVRQLPAAVLTSSRLAARLSYLHANGSPVPPLPDAEECGFVPAAAAAAAAAVVQEAAEGADVGRGAGPATPSTAAAAGEEPEAVAARAYEAAMDAGSGGVQARYAWERGLLQTTPNDDIAANARLLEGVCGTNVFETNPRLPAEPPASSGSGSGRGAAAAAQEAGGSGLWALSAYFNHACLDNTERYFLGDFLFVRASRDLPARAELSLAYLSPLMGAADRARALAERGFACGCELCAGEHEWRRRRPEQAAREQDLIDLCRVVQAQIAEAGCSNGSSSSSSSSSPVGRKRQLVSELEQLVSGLRNATQGRAWRGALYRPACELAELLQSCGDFKAAAEAFETAFGSLVQQVDGPDTDTGAGLGAGAGGDADAAGGSDAVTGPAAAQAEAVAAAAVAAAGAAAAVVGDRQLLSPGSAVLVAVRASVAWSLVGPARRYGPDGGATRQEQERRSEAAKQRAAFWEATARGLWSRYFGGNQDLFNVRFAESLRTIRGRTGGSG